MYSCIFYNNNKIANPYKIVNLFFLFLCYLTCETFFSGSRLWGMSHSLPSGIVSTHSILYKKVFEKTKIFYASWVYNWSKKTGMHWYFNSSKILCCDTWFWSRHCASKVTNNKEKKYRIHALNTLASCYVYKRVLSCVDYHKKDWKRKCYTNS